MHELKKDAQAMKEYLLKGDIKNFADILGKSWKAKKQVSNLVSNPEIEKIYSIATNFGAFSGKVSGAGGGGFMFFMIQPEKKYQLIQKLNQEAGKVYHFYFILDGTKSWKINK